MVSLLILLLRARMLVLIWAFIIDREVIYMLNSFCYSHC